LSLTCPERVSAVRSSRHADGCVYFPSSGCGESAARDPVAEAVVGLPRVADRDAGEKRQDPGGPHAVLAALGVHDDQHELPPGRRMHPGELPGGAEPGLVEVHDLRPDQVFRDRGQRGRDQPGGLPRSGRKRSRRGR
jgi:hypothetical protein